MYEFFKTLMYVNEPELINFMDVYIKGRELSLNYISNFELYFEFDLNGNVIGGFYGGFATFGE